eukprot:scaffold2069_cov254-Pinguiococcus_pyrenoidosus.AAC.24
MHQCINASMRLSLVSKHLFFDASRKRIFTSDPARVLESWRRLDGDEGDNDDHGDNISQPLTRAIVPSHHRACQPVHAEGGKAKTPPLTRSSCSSDTATGSCLQGGCRDVSPANLQNPVERMALVGAAKVARHPAQRTARVLQAIPGQERDM